jgi:hypothetical protein
MVGVAPDYTVDGSVLGLVSSVYRGILAPNAQNAQQPADVIAFLDQEMRTTIVPLVLAAQEEFWVTNYDQPVKQNVFQYTIPKRAAFATWRDVVFVDNAKQEINMSMLSPEYLKLTYPAGGMPPLYTFGFILKNDQIILYPNTSGSPTQYRLRMKIKRRPNNLTQTVNCAQIVAINTSTSVVTVNAVPTGWATTDTFDIIPNSPQFTSLRDDQTISLINANNITFSSPGVDPFTGQPLSALPTNTETGAFTMQVGDWICPSQMSCIPQVPYDMFSLLVQRGIIRVLESLGDTQNLTVAERRYQDMAVDFARTVSPRIDGTPKKMVNRNTPNFWGHYGFPFSR